MGGVGVVLWEWEWSCVSGSGWSGLVGVGGVGVVLWEWVEWSCVSGSGSGLVGVGGVVLWEWVEWSCVSGSGSGCGLYLSTKARSIAPVTLEVVKINTFGYLCACVVLQQYSLECCLVIPFDLVNLCEQCVHYSDSVGRLTA